jgi:chromosome segregation ATPase
MCVQVAVLDQARQASDRVAEAERMRLSAVQEAAYYRAKLAAVENSPESNVSRVEGDRVAELEKQLAMVSTECAEQQRRLSELDATLSAQTAQLQQAEMRADEATRMHQSLQGSHERTLRDHMDLRERHAAAEATLHEHKERAITHGSLLQQREAEHTSYQTQLEDLTRSRDQHVRALQQAGTAMEAASRRAEEVDSLYERAREQVSQLEADVAELRGELETRTSEVESARARVAELENAWAQSREEADALRALTTTGLGELLDTHRELRADEDRLTQGHGEQVQAVEMQVESLRQLLKETEQRAEDARKELSHERLRAQDLELQHSSLGSQLAGVRAQLAEVLAEHANARKDLSSKEMELRSKGREHSEANLRLGMLRNYLADNGMVVDESDLASSSGSGRSARVMQLQDDLAEQSRIRDEAERELDTVLQQKQDAEAQIAMLQDELERRKSHPSPVNGDDEDAAARAEEAERKLEETEQSYKARLQQLEEDYQLAVHYVK